MPSATQLHVRVLQRLLPQPQVHERQDGRASVSDGVHPEPVHSNIHRRESASLEIAHACLLASQGIVKRQRRAILGCHA